MSNILIAGIVSEALYFQLAALGDWRLHLPLFFAFYFALFALFIFAWLKIRRIPDMARSRRVLLFFAIAFRVTVFPTLPVLSDDIYRYAWEGKIQLQGFSPYEMAPNDPKLEPLRDSIYPVVNHKDVPTLYPPLTQFFFRIGARLSGWFGHPILWQKVIFLAFDFAVLAVLWRLVHRRGLSRNTVIFYAWNPLVILEFAGSAHNDALGIALLLSGLLWWQAHARYRATIAWALSFLAKYLAILVVPYLAWKRRWKELAVWMAVGAAGFVPFCACWLMTRGAKEYAGRWQFNGSVYPLLASAFSEPMVPKVLTALLFGVAAIWLAKRETDPAKFLYRMIVLSLLLAPTLHPWYFIWLIPFLCLFPNPAFFLWNGTIILSYTVWWRLQRYGVWNLHVGIQAIEYVPVYLVLGWETYRKLRAKRLSAA